jgi:protein pelota
MRLVHHDRATGRIRLRLDTPSDLWRMARLIHPGDLVGASTTRRDPEAPADVPGAERTRRRIYLEIRTEAVEFHGFTQHLRITGPIAVGPFDIGRHHTLDLTEGDEVTVVKPEPTLGERTLLAEGLEHRGDPTILIAAVDWGDSALVRLRGRAIESVAEVRRTIAGKQYDGGQSEKDRKSYAAEIVGLIVREGGSAAAVVVAGPGFLKEQIAEGIRAADASVAAKMKVLSASESGRAGIDELLRSGRALEALRGAVAAEEADLVERLVQGLAGGLRSAVGVKEVNDAVDAGAVETLLLSDRMLTDPSVQSLLERAYGARARLFIVREESDAGRRLVSLGRIGALLRYDWSRTPRAPH